MLRITCKRTQEFLTQEIFFSQISTMLFFHHFLNNMSLRKKCPYWELFWSVFSRIRTEYGEIRSISLYSVQMRENTDQNNSEKGHFSRSVSVLF